MKNYLEFISEDTDIPKCTRTHEEMVKWADRYREKNEYDDGYDKNKTEYLYIKEKTPKHHDIVVKNGYIFYNNMDYHNTFKWINILKKEKQEALERKKRSVSGKAYITAYYSKQLKKLIRKIKTRDINVYDKWHEEIYKHGYEELVLSVDSVDDVIKEYEWLTK